MRRHDGTGSSPGRRTLRKKLSSLDRKIEEMKECMRTIWFGQERNINREKINRLDEERKEVRNEIKRHRSQSTNSEVHQ